MSRVFLSLTCVADSWGIGDTNEREVREGRKEEELVFSHILTHKIVNTRGVERVVLSRV